MTRLTASFAALALASVAALGSGCQSTAPPAAEADRYPAAAMPRVLAQDDLHGELVHGDAVVTRSESGALEISVPVRTLLQKDVRAQYRFTFLDDRGRPLRPEPDWQYATLPARTQIYLDSASLQSEAVDWRLEVRPAR